MTDTKHEEAARRLLAAECHFRGDYTSQLIIEAGNPSALNTFAIAALAAISEALARAEKAEAELLLRRPTDADVAQTHAARREYRQKLKELYGSADALPMRIAKLETENTALRSKLEEARIIKRLNPLTQLNRHFPDEGIIGDCWRTCLAMILGCESPEDVPHLVAIAGAFDEENKWNPGGQEKMDSLVNEFLADKGLILVDIPFNFESVDEALEYHRVMNPRLAYILSGKSKNGCNHSVVCLGGKVFADPSQDQSGLVGPASDGYFWTGFIAYQPSARSQ